VDQQFEAMIVHSTTWKIPAVRVPSRMGEPLYNQLQGTTGEVLCELCGRVCYDSLGTGRSSEQYHQHIREVGHNSTIEHLNITVEVPPGWSYAFVDLLNRRGVWIEVVNSGVVRITYNPRVIADWHKHGIPQYRRGDSQLRLLSALQNTMHEVAPQITPPSPAYQYPEYKFKIVDPVSEDEHFFSVYMRGSRGFSHEQVRHRTAISPDHDEQAISQRSTRYVDESESNWIWHPLLKKFLRENEPSTIANKLIDLESYARNVYVDVAKEVQSWLQGQGLDKFSARKQARGAARGFLGMALPTELIVTAPISWWKWMFKMRMTDFADAEIRLIYSTLWGEVASDQSLYPFFRDFSVLEARDGIGLTLTDNKD
jgi:thymidylate synthase ThyX